MDSLLQIKKKTVSTHMFDNSDQFHGLLLHVLSTSILYIIVCEATQNKLFTLQTFLMKPCSVIKLFQVTSRRKSKTFMLGERAVHETGPHQQKFICINFLLVLGSGIESKVFESIFESLSLSLSLYIYIYIYIYICVPIILGSNILALLLLCRKPLNFHTLANFSLEITGSRNCYRIEPGINNQSIQERQ